MSTSVDEELDTPEAGMPALLCPEMLWPLTPDVPMERLAELDASRLEPAG